MTNGRLGRRGALGAAGGALLAGLTGLPVGLSDGEGEPIRVPADEPSIQAGVDAAGNGELVLVAEGIYQEAVEVSTPGITVRGADRTAVVLDGEFERSHGVHVEADGVAVENLTARHYGEAGVYWDGVAGFRGSYLTAHDSGGYGVYASRSRDGRFEYSYAAGHADAGFYLGRNHPFEATIERVIAERNALGYSGTSAGGDLTIRDSLWLDNGAGIVPHTLDRADAPQRATRVLGNVVRHNDDADVRFRTHTYPPFGTGILVRGGSENLIANNVVAGHENVGIAVDENVVEPSGNVVRGNLVSESGVADLGLGAPAGPGNRFANNGYTTSLPAGIEDDASRGDERVSEVYDRQATRARRTAFTGDARRTARRPPPQPPMADPTVPPRPAGRSTSVGPTPDET